MSNSIRMESLTLKPIDGTNFKIHYEKSKNIQFSEPDGLTAETILTISKQGRQRLQNQPRPEGALKKAGATSVRAGFEDAGIEQRNYSRGYGKDNWADGKFLDELMRTDEPETYAKVQELRQKCQDSGGSGPWWKADGWGTEEGEKYSREASAVRWDWYCRRCWCENGEVRNPVRGQRSVLEAIEVQHSDSVHDTTVGVYDGKSPDQASYLWNIITKFNVLLPAKMLNELTALNNMEKLTDKEKENLNQKLEKINSAVDKMKEAEKNYEGTHMFLRFGVMLDNGGNVTFHANYTGCEDKNGIMANSAEELLEKLRAS